ncbi:MAG: GIY-YIG nuclease family protein [Candidatus Uhrbacteria bacterium]
MHYAYILQSETSKTYHFGSTTNIIERIKTHNQGGSAYTSKHIPWKLIWYSAFLTKEKAEAFEKYLKTGSGYAFSRKRFI